MRGGLKLHELHGVFAFRIPAKAGIQGSSQIIAPGLLLSQEHDNECIRDVKEPDNAIRRKPTLPPFCEWQLPTQLRPLGVDGIALTMDDDLDAVLGDAKDWLAAQPEPEEGSATWYGLENFRQFIASLDMGPSALDLEQACYALGWHISDQYGTYDELPTIALFNDRVRRITKAMLRAE